MSQPLSAWPSAVRSPLLIDEMILLLAVIAVTLLSALPRLNLRSYRSTPVVGLVDLSRAMGGLAAGYVVFEALLASRRQIFKSG